MGGPLSGITIIELGGIGPVPFCGMMLADHGATVVRVERVGSASSATDPLSRSRRSIAVDLKHPDGVDVLRRLAAKADGLIEGFRPGVAERIGLGPEGLIGANPALVYGRMTGWGQDGPLAQAAGHDIDYIAVAGILHGCGAAGGPPVAPVNYLGDFGGGGMALAFGMVSALLWVRQGGCGQVVDCAMTEGASLLTGMTRDLAARGAWRDERGVNILDGGAPFYATYETADGKWIAVGAIEPQFYAALRRVVGVADDPLFDDQHDHAAWPAQKRRLGAIVRTRTRGEWVSLAEGTDACLAPVMSLHDAPRHPHAIARNAFVDVGGTMQPAPAPRFGMSPSPTPVPPRPAGADTDSLLRSVGYDDDDLARLRFGGTIGG